MNILKKGCKHSIGGQAVMEGVMMRSKYNLAVAVRKPNKKISVRKTKINSWQLKFKPLNWPFIRGVYSLFETLVVGIEALTYSANESLDEEEEKLSKKELVLTLGIAFIAAIGIFIVLPFFLSKLLVKGNVAFNIVDGLLRIGIFIAYIGLISRMKDIQTIFQYHGAEHKAVHAYEAGKKLTVKNAKPFTTLHPRCGTSFLLIVLTISIIVFSFIISDSWTVKFFARLVLLPVIAGSSYEILKLTAKFQGNIVLKAITAPGLWLQKITTSEPTDKQLEVAVNSLSAVLAMENSKKN